MARVVPLTDAKIRAFKARERMYKVPDGDGLYVYVSPKGTKAFKVRYLLDGKSSTITLGRYPAMSLSEARGKRDEVREQVARGVKPVLSRRSDKIDAMSFADLCDKYIDHRSDLSDLYVKDVRGLLGNHFYPTLANLTLDEIEPIHAIRCLEVMNKKGIVDAARKAGSLLDRIFRYAVTMQMMKRNPMADIDVRVLITPKKKRNFAHITDVNEFRTLLLDIEAYWGAHSIKQALRLMPYVFVRPANVRFAEWREFDFDEKIWKIPAEKMKMDREHIVPLTDSMIEIVENMRGISDRWVFPSPQSPHRNLSENTLNFALKRMGYAGKMTTHGFRHTASTLLNEHSHIHGFGRDIIEVQLAHAIGGVEGVYNKAIYLEKRRQLMAWWSDFIDRIKGDNGNFA